MKKKHPRSLSDQYPHTFAAWKDMWEKCNNPSHPEYPDNGARGIRVCDRWKSFNTFLKDMGPCPEDLGKN